MRDNRHRRLIIGSGLGLAVAIMVLLVSEIILPGTIDNFEAKSLDLRYALKIKKLEQSRGGQSIDDIVIIDIDNRSLNQFGRYHQWPRDYYTEVLDFLTTSKALVVGFDILFNEPDIDRRADELLVSASRHAGNVCHAISFSAAEPDAFLYKMEAAPAALDTAEFSYLFAENIMKQFPAADRFDGKLFALYLAAARIGFVNFTPDDDSVIRKMPLFMNFAGELYPSLAMAMVLFLYDVQNSDIEIQPGKFIRLQVTTDQGPEKVTIPIDRQGQMLINYMGGYQTFRYISFYDVWARRVPAEFFEGKIVLIGSSAPGLYDMRSVPFQNAFPGVEIHANILCDILTQSFIHQNSALGSAVILCLLCLLTGAMAPFFRFRFNIPMILAILIGYLSISFVLFVNHRIWIENIRPLIGIVITYTAVLSYRYVDESRDKRKIRSMFQHYISASVVDELLKNPGMLKLGGERKVATAFFSDIKDFTTVSESLSPEELVAVLNEYLSVMTEIVFKYQGYLDKYAGDAIMAIFGIPVEQDGHAVNACHAALEMMRELEKLREKWQREGKPQFECRIGLNSGPMIAGNIGGHNRFDYTAIGDSVNLASRLEGVNKVYGTSIIISEDTFMLVQDKFWCRELDFIRVKGKNNPVRIYELLAPKTQELNPIRSASLECFLKGLAIYRQQDWIHAFDMFQKALTLDSQDGPSKEFIRRCKRYIENPLLARSDNVFVLYEK
ncbi:MAG: adenylate/guanylate cyclase domain-containing protein [candidate division KSB1 bacterium]|nr:adenylate/guanylate cyclase domain-containing protein [candidate division KSB1 bacterium]MDZ7339855.1 adenylate/guanylate cyclase domain-containing protein [candidate division KSB1 bacterium]